ncbi:MAG: hypothetical protein LIP01_05440 [Tannerellaceae bacterium]|nr:hypothetical protein [Tannerellaceae bacterium]
MSLEHNYKSIANWWTAGSLPAGVESGVTKKITGTYNSRNANLETALEETWNDEQYWKTYPSKPISRIKSGLEELIQNTLKNEGRISIQTIYNFLTEEPYGFLPCNMTAFFMGFLLKEYINDKYSWSDELSSNELTLDKLKEMVDEVIKLDITPNNRYRPKYIVTMTPEEKAFIEGTSIAFDIPKRTCSSIESARDRVRGKMRDNLYFPIWTLREIIADKSLQTETNIIQELIDNYQDLVNNQTAKSDNDVAIKIGKTFLIHPNAATDLHNLLTEENCKKGMMIYLDSYNDGELPVLAREIDDKGRYLNELKQKIDAGEANWVWKRQTVDKQIEVVILEYKIIIETRKLLGSCVTYEEAINAWNEKCGNLKLAYETMKNYVTDLKPFLLLLKEIKSQGSLQEDKKETFLNYLKGYGSEFNTFYQNQFNIFKQACSFYLSELNDSDKEKVFRKMSSGCFTMDNATYGKSVEDTVTAYKKELVSIKLKELWKEKNKLHLSIHMEHST